MSDRESQDQQERKTAVEDEEQPRLIEKSDPTQLVRAEVLKGRFLGHKRGRVGAPTQRAFQRISTDVLEATELTQAPQGGILKVLYIMKHALIGAPIATAQQEQERLTKFKALAVLSSDAISSVAYATEGILLSLLAAGSRVLGLTLPLSFATHYITRNRTHGSDFSHFLPSHGRPHYRRSLLSRLSGNGEDPALRDRTSTISHKAAMFYYPSACVTGGITYPRFRLFVLRRSLLEDYKIYS